MPGGDGTGPMGMGPMTGRAAGYCAGYAAPGFVNRGPGRGFGRGGGRGWRNRYYATGLPGWARAGVPPAWGPPIEATPEAELNDLRAQAQHLSNLLEGIQKRVDELTAEKKD